MYHHVKSLCTTSMSENRIRTSGKFSLNSSAAKTGELAAAMQYTVQGWSCDDPERRDLLMDIGTEEISHLEVVGALIKMHFMPAKKELEDAEQDLLVAVTGGGGLNLFNSAGNPRTADYLRFPVSSTSTSATTSRPKPARRSPTNDSCTSLMT
jgi:Mn-containing catalase